MRVYIAAKFEARDVMKGIRARVREMGHECLCRWMDIETDETQNEKKALREAEVDLIELSRTDVLVIDEVVNESGRGKYVELGYALAVFPNKHKVEKTLPHPLGVKDRIHIVGPARTVFSHYATLHNDWEGFFTWLGKEGVD